MSPRPRRQSSAGPIRAAGLAAAVVAAVGCLVGGAVLLHDRDAAGADAARLRAIRAEMDDAIRERQRVEAGLRKPDPNLGDQPEHTRLPQYGASAEWRAVMRRLSNLEDERRQILGRRPALRP